MNNWKSWTIAACVMALAGSVGCADVDDQPDEDVTGAHMSIELPEQSDVTHMHYTVETCDGEPVEVDEPIVALKNLTLPGGIDTFENRPFDVDSQHKFADLFLFLDAGCYQVHIQPLTSDDPDDISEQCLPIFEDELWVETGDVTEEILISQCAGPEDGKGILDIIAALNHPPQLTDLDLEPQKFLECPEEEDALRICVEAKDPDKDPMNFKWWQAGDFGFPILDDVTDEPLLLEDAPGIAAVTVVEPTPDNDGIFEPTPGHARQCVDISFEQPAQNHNYTALVAVLDKLHKTPGQLITFEQWFADLGIVDEYGITNQVGSPILSRDTQFLEFYVGNCEEAIGICNQSYGYWAHRPKDQSVIERWENSGFVPFETNATSLCDGITNVTPEPWIDVLRMTGPVGLYYRLGRQYIAAELNIAQFWSDPALAEDAFPGILADIAEAEQLLNDATTCGANSPGSRTLTDPGGTINELQERLKEFNESCNGDLNGDL